MKILVTIIQCRRVALPYLFIKYSVPMMERKTRSKVEVHLVQHQIPNNLHSRMATSDYPASKEKTVEEFTELGLYGNSKITRHARSNPNYPSLPSWQIGFEYALKSDADFFLWMEDDAFVFDENCDKWPGLLKGKLVGSYRREPDGYIRCAHYVCTREFIEKFIDILRDNSAWDIKRSIFSDENKRILDLNSPRMEPRITKYAADRWVDLGSSNAGRYSTGIKSRHYLADLLARVCPSEGDILNLDFPELSLTSSFPKTAIAFLRSLW